MKSRKGIIAACRTEREKTNLKAIVCSMKMI
jgi:hypothetical protein